MKKLFLLLFISAGLLFSCTKVKNSTEYQQLQKERDSLLMQTTSANSEIEEMMAVINNVEENFNQIREAEKYLAVQSADQGELSSNTKDRINDNFKMVNEILKKNREQLADLNKKFSSSTGQVAALKKTIDRLNRELEERVSEISELQTELSRRDVRIAELTSNVDELSSNLSELSGHVEEQSSTILQQERALNTAYYVFGTMSELKSQKILSGGFLRTTKVLKDSFNEDYFLKIDIRETTRIPLYATDAELWSNHPKGTYAYEPASDGTLTFVIIDTEGFWSLTKYLVIEVK